METPIVHLFSATPAEAQDVLRTTLPLARQPDARVIICISRGEGLKEPELDSSWHLLPLKPAVAF